MKLPIGDSFPLDWDRQGDELVELLLNELQEADPSIAQHSWTHGPPYYELQLSVEGELIRGHLRFQRTASEKRKGLVRATLLVDDPAVSRAQKALWRDALERARARVGSLATYDWWAVVGAKNSEHALAAAFEIAGMTLTPFADPYMEVSEGVGNLGGASVSWSYPVVVNGSADAHAPRAAFRKASDCLNLLCLLLSIAWDSSWKIRRTPTDLRIDPARLPVSVMHEGLRNETGDNWQKTEVAHPTWLESALDLCLHEDDTRRLVLAHAQGMRLEDEGFSSYALLAYVAVLESIGSRYVQLTECSCCEACSEKTGYSRQFRYSVDLVLDEWQQRRVADAYKLRSGTAHAGRLHGQELMATLWRTDYAGTYHLRETFQWDQVATLRKASRQLLTMLFEDRLPARPKLNGQIEP